MIIEKVSSHALLGVWHQDDLKWNCPVEEMTSTSSLSDIQTRAEGESLYIR